MSQAGLLCSLRNLLRVAHSVVTSKSCKKLTRAAVELWWTIMLLTMQVQVANSIAKHGKAG